MLRTATQIEIEATKAYIFAGEIHHLVTTQQGKDQWYEFSVYIRLPDGARWVADCTNYEVAQILARSLSLHYKIPVLDKVAEVEG